MSYTQLLVGYGPYYIIGFVVTFFTLMSSRYMLGFNIYPQERIVRVMFVSALWLPSLVVCTILAYVKRSDKLITAQEETETLRKQLEKANAALAEQANVQVEPTEEVVEQTDEEPVAFAKTDNPKPVKKKGMFSW